MSRLPALTQAKPHLLDFAKMLQAAARRQGLDLPALAAALGYGKQQFPAVYNWLGGKNGPGPDIRPKLASVLGLTEDQVTAPLKRTDHPGNRRRRTEETPVERARRLHKRVNGLGPAQRAVVLAEQQAGPTAATWMLQPVPVPEPVRDVFSIVGRSDGQITVRLQATLDPQRGMALARYLMDFGLIVVGEGEGPPG